MTDINLGWLREAEDTEYLHKGGLTFGAPALGNIPEEFDTRSIINVESQGQTNSCEGHALSSLVEANAWIAARNGDLTAPDQFSRWFAYLQAQKFGGHFGSDQGASISAGIKAAKQVGCCKETTLPFPGRYVKTIPAAAMTEASQFKFRSHADMRAYDQMFSYIAGGFGGINIGITWTSRLANSTGVIELADVKGRGGGHALLVWGYSKRVDSRGRKYLWLHNSHGKSWGNGGRAEVAPDVFDWWGQNQSAEMIGGSDLSGYETPRLIGFANIV